MANSKATHRQTTSTPSVPPVDLRTNGHEAFAVQSADRFIAANHPHVAALLNDGARGHHEQHLTGAQLAGHECARPNCGCRNEDLAHADGEVDITVDGHQLRACASGSLTPEQTNLVFDEVGGWHWTAPIETELRTPNSDGTADEPALAARTVVTPWGRNEQGRQVDGDHVTVWVTAGGVETVELAPDQVRDVARQLVEFAARLQALGDRADEALRALRARR